jgi:three-Cys-motif partner protein
VQKEKLRDWWLKHIQELMKIKINNKDININSFIDKEVYPYKKEEAYHTIKKLVIYKYYVDIYTRIISKHYKNFYYFDLFAGSGIVQISIENVNLNLFGSALISVLKPIKRFNKYVYVEIDEKKYNSLKYLLRRIKENYIKDLDYQLLNVDMNNINAYHDFFNQCEHALVVVDPEGLEPEWTTMEKILKHNCDVLITYMEEGIQRVIGKAKNNPKGKETPENFLGSNIDPDRITPEEFKEKYIEQIRKTGKEAIKTIEAKSKQYSYDIIIATKETRGKNPWLRFVEELRKKLDIKDETLKAIIEQLLGKQRTFNNYPHQNNGKA